MTGILYLLTSPSGKNYIGQTSTKRTNNPQRLLRVRWEHHVNSARRYECTSAIGAAIRKYGPENFQKRILVVLTSDHEILDTAEKRAIQVYNTRVPNGYNITEGGQDGRPTPESIEKTRVGLLSYWSVESRRKAESKRHTEMWQDPDYRTMIVAAQRTYYEDKSNRIASRKTKIGSSKYYNRAIIALKEPRTEIQREVLSRVSLGDKYQDALLKFDGNKEITRYVNAIRDGLIVFEPLALLAT